MQPIFCAEHCQSSDISVLTDLGKSLVQIFALGERMVTAMKNDDVFINSILLEGITISQRTVIEHLVKK